MKTYSSSNSGYLGYSYSQSGNLKAVKLEGIELSTPTIKDKTYPLARRLYLDTFGGLPTQGAQAFIDFVKGPQGQQIAKDNGFVPLQ